MITYELTSWNCDEVHITIDHDKLEEGTLEQINSFWSGSEYRLSEANGNLEHAVVKFLADTALNYQVANDYNVYGVMTELGEEEGWLPLDGSKGITLHYCCHTEFDCKIQKTRIHNEAPNLPTGNC